VVDKRVDDKLGVLDSSTLIDDDKVGLDIDTDANSTTEDKEGALTTGVVAISSPDATVGTSDADAGDMIVDGEDIGQFLCVDL
jgi:hypothetical protein